MSSPTQTSKTASINIGKPYRSARFLVPAHITLPTTNLPQAISITDKALVHRAQKVLRMAVGDVMTLIDPVQEIAVLATIQRIDNHQLLVRVEAVQPSQSNLPHITVLAGLIKGTRWDWMIEKATELGVRRMIPIQSDHTVVDLSGKDVSKKVAKWQQTAIGAVEQCDGRFIPEITQPMNISETFTFLQTCPQSLCRGAKGFQQVSGTTPQPLYKPAKLVMMEGGDERVALASSIAANHYPEALVMAIGPEGGWSARECDAMQAEGFMKTQLGNRILRAETAVITALSIITGIYDGQGEGH